MNPQPLEIHAATAPAPSKPACAKPAAESVATTIAWPDAVAERLPSAAGVAGKYRCAK
jgi:hypothetical protein